MVRAHDLILGLALLAACIVQPAAADWKVTHGRKALGFPPTGPIATVAAKAPSQGFVARLQLECFIHPQAGALVLAVTLSKPTAPGFLAYRYQVDDAPIVRQPPATRTSLTSASLSPFPAGLGAARRFDLTLIPAAGPELAFTFDVTGADKAIKAIPCVDGGGTNIR